MGLSRRVMRSIREHKGIKAVLVMTALLWAIHFLAFLMPGARLWGINHLVFLPSAYTLAYVLGGLCVAAMFFPSLREAGAKLYEAVAEWLLARPSRAKWMILAAAALVVFWLARLPVFVLGDSIPAMANIGSDKPAIFKWSEMGAIYAAYLVAQIIPYTGARLGEYAYGVIAVGSGAVTVYFFCCLAYEIGKDAAGRLFMLCLILGAGWIVLFFGYTENYPILWPFMSAYLYFSVQFLREKGSLVWPTVMLLAALILHLQTLFFLASFPLLLVARGKPARFYAAHKKAIRLAAAVACVAVAFAIIRMYQDSQELRSYLIPLLNGRPPAADYSLFSPTHMADILNQFFLLAPLLPLLVVLGWKGWRVMLTDKIDLFLSLLSLGGMIFLFGIDPKLGMGRDWDLFALVGLPPTILFAKNMIDLKRLTPALYPAIAVAAAVMVFPFVAANQRYDSALANYQFLLGLDLPRSRSGMVILRNLYSDIGDSARADSLDGVMREKLPVTRLIPLAYSLAEEGKLDEAMVLVDSVELFDPGSPEFLTLRGKIYLKQGKYVHAIQDLERAARLGRYDSRVFSNLAEAYCRLERYDRMLGALREAQRLDPHDEYTIDGLTTAFFYLGQFDSAFVYAQQRIATGTAPALSFLAAGVSAANLGYRDKAKVYLERFVEMAPDDPNRGRAEQLLKQMENERGADEAYK